LAHAKHMSQFVKCFCSVQNLYGVYRLSVAYCLFVCLQPVATAAPSYGCIPAPCPQTVPTPYIICLSSVLLHRDQWVQRLVDKFKTYIFYYPIAWAKSLSYGYQFLGPSLTGNVASHWYNITILYCNAYLQSHAKSGLTSDGWKCPPWFFCKRSWFSISASIRPSDTMHMFIVCLWHLTL
jgi:hypothetical protein